ncbi:MAG: GHKL domain-containing protein [Anaerolineales bacterium]|nr:GHKL domain-containing protein [Anaerolineales bacterium]
MDNANMSIPLSAALSERTAAEEVRRQNQLILQLGYLRQAFEAVPNAVTILNAHRQIVYANPAFCHYIGVNDPEALHGERVGEALTCVHAHVGPGGCGTSDFCSTCGALHAMLQAQQGTKSVKECRIIRRNAGELEAVDLRVWATPFEIETRPFTIFAAVDIADEKRRQILERIFFHDIRNTAGVIFGVAELMRHGVPETAEAEFHALLLQASRKLLDEINAQQQLLAAERGELVVSFAPLLARDLLESLIALYAQHDVAADRHLRLDPAAEQFVLHSDEALLGRVIGNLVKNALEACAAGDAVTVRCWQAEEQAHFSVHNSTVMPRHVQLQIFKRSFSTKGRDRGLGTYSIKLLTEQYLRGMVSFVSNEQVGTIFTAVYPLHP